MDRLVDRRTKLVCCTGASNFLGTKNPISGIRGIAGRSGYDQPTGERRSYLLIDGAQLVPSTYVNVREMDPDFLVFSFHKMLAPFGVGALYSREGILESLLPFLYGGDMIAEGQVSPEYVGYNELPWKFTAGTPNILGAIISAQAIRMLLDLALHPGEDVYFNSVLKLEPGDIRDAMNRIALYTRQLVRHALESISSIPGVTVYGPPVGVERSPLVSFNVRGRNPMELAELLNEQGVESRAGCHCATLAHHFLELDPPASCRLSFYFYNTLEEVQIAVEALERIVSGKVRRGMPPGNAPVRPEPEIPAWISSGKPMYT
jgi:cysteine desulfurase/selenocysteine lyase